MATVRQAAILVGGLGSRLGGAVADVPKPMLEVAGRPFLHWLMRELCRFGVEEVVLLAGHLAEVVQAAAPGLEAGMPRPMRVIVAVEEGRAGTGGALAQAAPLLDERFLLLNGDSFLDWNLARLLADGAADGAEVLCRMVARRTADASRSGVLAVEGDRVVGFRERPEPGETGGLVNAGIYLLRREMVGGWAGPFSLERDGLPAAAQAGSVRATVGEGYFIDIGVPDDLARARRELGDRVRRPALFLDRDGVINRDLGWVGTRERFEWVDGAVAMTRAAADRGWHVFVATNQSGIARGFYSEGQFGSLTRWMVDTIREGGGNVDDWRYCPTHPEAPVERYRRRDERRKPGPGMLLELLAAWEVAPGRCLFVGDTATDMQAAAAAGVAGHPFDGTNWPELPSL